MRSLPLILAALFCLVGLSASDEASASATGQHSKKKKKGKKGKKKKGKKGKKKKGKKKKGKKKKGQHNGGSNNGGSNNGNPPNDDGGDDDDAPSCDGNLPAGMTSKIRGAGTRGSFNFGGKIEVRDNGVTGAFNVALAPRPGAGSTFLVTCRFREFTNVSVTPGRATFDTSGRCMRLLETGYEEWFIANNRVQIVNREGGDAIDMNILGDDGGIAIPGGLLESGDFTFIIDEG